jgi:hypothetical protein
MTRGSSKHLRDIYGLVKIDDTMDMNWLEKEIAARNLTMYGSMSIRNYSVGFFSNVKPVVLSLIFASI